MILNIADIHSHILPCVDDGARSLDIAKEMISIAYTENIRSIIVTPHYDGKYFNVTKDMVLRKKEELHAWLSKAYTDMRIYPGCEMYYSHTAVELLGKGKIQTLAGSRYVLVEFAEDITSTFLKGGLQDIIYKGYCPILAHAERLLVLQREFECVLLIKNMGAYIQVNADSIISHTGFWKNTVVKKMLSKRLIDFIATDAHGSLKRPPKIKKCAEFMELKYGKDYTEQIMVFNPYKVITDKEI